MSMNAGINILFYKMMPVVHMISILKGSGWGHIDGIIVIEYYYDISDVDRHVLDQDNWKDAEKFINDLESKGMTICISLENENKVEAGFTFDPEKKLFVYLYDSRPRLCECNKFTDYTWLLRRIVCPFISSGCGILEISCNDSN